MKLSEVRLYVSSELAARRLKGETLDVLGLVDPRTGRPPTTWQRAEELLVGDAIRNRVDPAREIGHVWPVAQGADMSMTKRGTFMRASGALSPKDEAAARVAWETTTESAKAIGARFGVSRNTVIGLAKRRRWILFKPPTPKAESPDVIARQFLRLPKTHVDRSRTLFDRCDELDAQLKAALEAARIPASRMYAPRQPPRAP